MTIAIKLRSLLVWALFLCVVAPIEAQQQLHESQVQNLVADLASKGTITAAQQESYIYGDDTGTANAYAVTLTPAPTLVEGSVVAVKIANTNTGTATLSVNGSGVTTVTTVTSGTPPTSPPPSGTTTVVVSDHNLDDETTPWKICAVGNCGGGTPGGTNAPASYSITFNNTSPSTDGHSALIQQTTVSTAKQTNILFIHRTGVCPNCTWVHTHKRLYVDSSGGTPNNVEADSMHEYGGKFRMYGLQCNLTKHYWQIANDVESWQTTPLSCAGFTMNAWHEIEAVYHTDLGDTGCGGNGCLHYDWIAVDGVETDWNLTRPSDAPNNWANGDVDQFQCDIAGGSKTCKIYIDDAWFESGTGTPPSGTISTGTTGGGTTVTTTTTTTGTTINKKGNAGLIAGDLVAGQIALFVYDGSSWQLINPSSAVSSGTTTGSAATWYQEIPIGTADGTNSDFFLSYAPVSPYVILMENGVIQSPYTRFTLSANHITMTSPPVATDELVAWYFPGSADGQRSGGTAPTSLIRGSVALTSGSGGVTSLAVPFPAGSQAGDMALLFVTDSGGNGGSGGFRTMPSGWNLIVNGGTGGSTPLGGVNWYGYAAWRILTSGDIATGSITAATNGPTFSPNAAVAAALVTFIGASSGIREGVVNPNVALANPDVLSTSSAVLNGEIGIFFGCLALESTATISISPGSVLQSVSTRDATGVLALATMPGGVSNITFTRVAAGTTGADFVVIVKP